MSETKHDEAFKVVDRRLFSPEGELRKEVAEQQDARARCSVCTERQNIRPQCASTREVPQPPVPSPAKPQADGGAPPAQSAFCLSAHMNSENLLNCVRWGRTRPCLLGGYADPRTGQPMLDLEGAREMIDMLDVLREKTLGNLAPEERRAPLRMSLET